MKSLLSITLLAASAALTGGCGQAWGECTIVCQGTRHNWTHVFGPDDDYTEEGCEERAENAEIDTSVCEAQWESY